MSQLNVRKEERDALDELDQPDENKPGPLANSLSITMRAAWSVIGRCSIKQGFGAGAMGAVMYGLLPNHITGALLLTIGAGSTAATIGWWIDQRMSRPPQGK